MGLFVTVTLARLLDPKDFGLLAMAMVFSGLADQTQFFGVGPAGTGKTYVLNQYINYLKARRIPVSITASTGIAATHLEGTTIHAWSGIGIKDSLSPRQLRDLKTKKYLKSIGRA